MQTDEIDKIAEAIVKAQAEIGGAAKTGKNPHFGNEYPTLAATLAAIRGPFATNGLAIHQAFRRFNDGQLCLVTRILHSSGQWMEDDGIPLLLGKQDMQGLGSATTYARRYGVMCAANCAPEDDDGNAAVGPTRDTGKPVTVKRGTAISVESRRHNHPSGTSVGEKPTAQTEPPAKPHAIDVPAPATPNEMKPAWDAWCKEFLHAIGTSDDVETMNAWIFANEAPFKSLYTFSPTAHGHIDKQIRARADKLAPVAAE